MNFKEYPSYKDSGVEWLGKVPEHWVIGRLKNLVQIKNGSDYKHIEAEKSDGSYPVYGSGGVFTYASDFMYDKESILLGRKGTIDKPLYVTEPFWAVDTMFYTKIKKNAVGKFVYYQALGFPFGKYSSNTALPSMTQTDLLNLAITIPSVEEQTQIVSFLESETSRIDNLIAKQEKLIEKLEEHRKSVISHAVTKGLDPNAPMKDSGVEWLGEVPEHWSTPSTKYLLDKPITDGPHETPNFVDEGIPFISAEAISKGKIDFNKKRGYISPELNELYSKKYSPNLEDIYMVKSGATTGKIAMVETNQVFNIWSPLAVFRCDKSKLIPKYLLYVFNSKHYYNALVLNWSYGTQQNIGMGVLSNIKIPLPSLEEQKQIIEILDTKCTKIDSLVAKQAHLINKLKEYRTSIISHAVTGKIDVRDLVA